MCHLLNVASPSTKNREFCAMAHKIHLYTKEEVQHMKPGTLNSKDEDTSSIAGLDPKEVKGLLPPPVSSAE